ncbi:hypothetical protein LX32DRAFT_274708 [Colletotrichum zoysiae]|uniref:Uncharacterized protein n=1 Tax=Colletotrichum zoysiae TaxID=1216348 RepID=A0AAD9M394_9PEZI|nr:hypothetical protein LX32DRAFT_274708 [Colletotrichum zoysiae]
MWVLLLFYNTTAIEKWATTKRRMKRGCMVKRRKAMAKEDNGPPLAYLTACDSAASTARRKAVGLRPFVHTCLAACLRWTLKARLPPARRAYHLSRAVTVSSHHLTRLLLQSRYFPLREDFGKTRVFLWSFSCSHPPICTSCCSMSMTRLNCSELGVFKPIWAKYSLLAGSS